MVRQKPDAYERRKKRVRDGTAILKLLGEGGYDIIKGLVEKVAYGGTCAPDAPCRREARAAIDALGHPERHARCDHWGPHAREVLRQRWENGEDINDIAASYGLSRNAIVKQAKGHGWTPRRPARLWDPADVEKAREMWSDGIPAKDIAEYFGKSPNAIRTMAGYRKWPTHPAYKKRWSKEEIEEAVRLRREGHPCSYISKKVGHSRSSVNTMCLQHGVTDPRPKPDEKMKEWIRKNYQPRSRTHGIDQMVEKTGLGYFTVKKVIREAGLSATTCHPTARQIAHVKNYYRRGTKRGIERMMKNTGLSLHSVRKIVRGKTK